MTGSGSLKRSTESTSRHFNVPGLLLAAIAIACGALQPTLADCPRMCDCKWKSGKESVMCINASLTQIPRKLDGSTQLLDLSGNSLGEIPRDAFAEAGLLNIQKLFLARCRLSILDRYAFRKLTNLVELDLSQNALVAVPSASFETISGLRELRLSGNPILSLVADGFKSVPQLIRLDLSSCHVSSIASRAFAGLENSLEWLKLDGNRLPVFASPVISGLNGLHGLELSDNPWNCSCDLRPLREWMLQRNVPSTIPPICKAPSRLAGRSWNSIDLDDFACAPLASAHFKVAAATERSDVTLSCAVKGVPPPEVRWLGQGSRPIANLSGSNPSNMRRLFLIRTSTTGSNLTIISVEERDAGGYVCLAQNRAGKAQANVTLYINQRPYEDALTGRLVAAILSVAMLLLAASFLVALCVCKLRKQRKGWTLAPFRPNDLHEDSYEKIEMNHKKTEQSIKSNGSVSVGVVQPFRVPYNRRKNGWYRGVALTDEDEGGYEAEAETPTPTGPLPSSIASPWTTDSKRSSKTTLQPKNWRQRPDSLKCGSNVPGSNPSLPIRRGSLEHSNDIAAAVAAGLPQHVLKKQVLSGSGGSLYTSLPSDSEERSPTDFNVPSPLNHELSSQTHSASNDLSVFLTLPRRERKSQSIYGSESPLLADSRYGSLGGSSSSSHRAGAELPSISSGSGLYYPRASSLLSLSSLSDVRTYKGRTGPSLPGSPTGSSIVETPILKPLGKETLLSRPVPCSLKATDSSSIYEGRTSQLDKFLDEYQRLHDQLSEMKETYESVRRPDFSRLPRSILKNKNALMSPEASVSYRRRFPPYWLPRDTLMRRISGTDNFESWS